MKKVLSMLLVVLAIVGLFAGCGSEEEPKNEIVITPNGLQHGNFGENQEAPVGNEPLDIGDPLAIETPYGNLYYPDKWVDSLRYSKNETDNGVAFEFYGTVNGREELIYIIIFGYETDNSFPVGTISGDGFENVQISVELSDFIPDSNWSQDDADTMCAMQESVNYITEKLKENPNFKSN